METKQCSYEYSRPWRGNESDGTGRFTTARHCYVSALLMTQQPVAKTDGVIMACLCGVPTIGPLAASVQSDELFYGPYRDIGFANVQSEDRVHSNPIHADRQWCNHVPSVVSYDIFANVYPRVTAYPILTRLDRARSIFSSLDCNISASVTAGVCRAPMSNHSSTETRSVAQFWAPSPGQRRSGVCDGL
jgi:hypothetical protein